MGQSWLALVAEDFVRLALGPAWLAAVPLVRVLAIAGGLFGIMQNGIPVLSATGHARLSARLTGARAAATVLALVAAGVWGNVMLVALARAAVTAAFIPGVFYTLSRVLPITPGDLLARGWRPLGAALPLAAAVRLAQAAAPDLPWLRLPLAAGAGAAAYAGAILLLWRLAGRPPGVEAGVAAALLRRLRPPR